MKPKIKSSAQRALNIAHREANMTDAEKLRSIGRDYVGYDFAKVLFRIADLLDAVPPETLASAPAKPEALTLIQRRSPGSIYPNRVGCYEEPSKG